MRQKANLLKTLPLLIFIVSITSCSILSKQECQTMNWAEKGKNDGSVGESSEKFTKYKNACLNYSITADKVTYEKGRLEGLGIFCTNDEGYQYGLKGSTYTGVCPKELETDFLKGFNLGKREHDTKKKAKELKEQEEDQAAKEMAIRTHTECSTDKDCTLPRSCISNQCEGGKHCNSDSDCYVKRSCVKDEQWINGYNVQVKVCK